MPQTKTDLLDVRGIGPAKVHWFGAETLEEITRFVGKVFEAVCGLLCKGFRRPSDFPF